MAASVAMTATATATATLATLAARQLWDLPTETTTIPSSALCTPFKLPSGGVLSLASDSALTLTSDVLFQPACTGSYTDGVSAVEQVKDPFYASTTPQIYVIAATTVIAWVLVVMLIITPRTSFVGSPSSAPAFSLSTSHGIIGGATGGAPNTIGVGSRPWLQKAAALTVAIALTIATADSFKEAAKQYKYGYMSADVLRDVVLGSLEIRITRVVSDVFVWLAQVQTLIRLFPRHKEKVLIKWIGFALIIFDSTFSCLNSFLIDSTDRPGHFQDAIPALSYLFELALGLLYAAWVLYYAVTKRRYSFYHHKMRSISLIAALSTTAILTPVVFFVTDVSNTDVAGWGDYFRWVGAAAASVVVWEWVERIEALERDEKKDGILGREIFDGDEMLDTMGSEEAVGWSGGRVSRRFRRNGNNGVGGGDVGSSALERGVQRKVQGVAQRFRGSQSNPQVVQHFPLGRAHSSTTSRAATEKPVQAALREKPEAMPMLGHPSPPPAVASPISRADTTSAASTVYVVRHDTAAAMADVPQPIRRRADMDENRNTALTVEAPRRQRTSVQRDPEKEEAPQAAPEQSSEARTTGGKWYAVGNPFKRKRASPPAEVQQARRDAEAARRKARPVGVRTVSTGTTASVPRHNVGRWDLSGRLGILAADAGEQVRERAARKRPEGEDLPVMVIPAPQRGAGKTWSPEVPATTTSAPQQQLVDLGAATVDAGTEQPAGPISRSAVGMTASAAPTIISAPSRSSPPPSADDVSRANNSTPSGITVVPAPRRSPLRIGTSAQDGSTSGAGSASADLL